MHRVGGVVAAVLALLLSGALQIPRASAHAEVGAEPVRRAPAAAGRHGTGAAGAPVPGRYIVRFRDGEDARAQATALASRGGRLISVHRDIVDAATLELPVDAVRGLTRNPAVVSVEPDRVVRTAAVQSNPPWGLDRSDQRPLPLSASYTSSAQGNDVTAYVVDSGIYDGHKDFGGRVISGYGAVDDGIDTDDCNGHGTHVAGTLGGAVHGIAKATRLVPVRVVDCDGFGYMSEMLDGFDWVARNHPAGTPAVANVSLGIPASAIFDAAVQALVDKGITVVAAAGNDNGNACDWSPARVPDVLTIGATTASDARAAFSNVGPCVDLFAPGQGIRSADTFRAGGSVTMSGTSMAAPHVAGAAAVLLGQWPSMTPTQVASYLIGDATPNRIADVGAGSPNRLLHVAPTGMTRAANDAFGKAIELSILRPSTVADTNLGATVQAGEPVHAGVSGGASVWWKFTAPAGGTVTLSTRYTTFDTTLAVYTGSRLSELAEVAANDNAASAGWSKVSFPVTAGVTYRIAVDGRRAATGTVVLNVEPALSAAPAVTVMSAPTSRWTLDPMVSAAWSGTSEVGITSYRVARRVTTRYTGGAFEPWLETSHRSASFPAATGTKYCMRARAIDLLGVTGPASKARCTAVPLQAHELGYNRDYWTSQDVAGAYGGAVQRSSTAGALMTQSAYAKHVALIVSRCPKCGTVEIYRNQHLVRTIALTAPDLRRRQIIPLQSSTTPLSAEWMVQVVSSGKPVVIEGFGIFK